MTNQQTPLPQRPWTALPAGTARILRPTIPAVTDEIIAAIRAEVSAYARPLEGSFGVAVRRGVEEALGQFVAIIEDPEVDRSASRAVYFGLGRGEAREGRTLDALLAAYRVGARVAWRRVAEAARAAGLDAASLSLLAESIFAYIDELSAQSAEGFAEAQSEAAGERERRQRELVALLLADPAADEGTVDSAAEALGLDSARAVAALVWREPSRRVAPRLPVDSIVGRIDDRLSCALVPDAEAPGRREEVRRALRGTPAGLGPPVPLRRASRSAARARIAHRLAVDGVVSAEGGLVVAGERLVELILHRDQALLEELAERALMPLAAETSASRARLADTLRAWLDHQGQVSAVAGALHVHAQTVRYRLGRLRDLFGDRLADPDARFELELALRAQGTGGSPGRPLPPPAVRARG
jgi:hypothetical protein